ncbi:turripeptide Lol9.1-like [Colias croceus]|uniref:turripeptide Lol9.1-like n=1 Tax=Colias crocea TaxID=72248 RepID=UPI001E27B39E|nr:turripeptide Lol9.1-like [Colias croceus]
MVAIYALATLLIISHCEGKSELMECIRGEQAVCGNDGITYSNMCDLEIVRLVRTNLTVVHEGPCNSLIKTLIRALQMQQPRKNINSLRIRPWG